MTFATLEAIFRALQSAGAQYVVVGGLAVNAHGYQRFTQDIDLSLLMNPDNLRAALTALAGLGYRPIIPVDMFDFVDASKREEWIANRNLQVFSLISDTHRDATIDILAAVPFEFAKERLRALVGELAPGLHVPFASVETLIAMKEGTGRARDRDDVEHLRRIMDESKRNG